MQMEVDMQALLPKLAQRIAQLEIELAVLQTALEKYQNSESELTTESDPSKGTTSPE